jgi:hypothetical protein
MSPLLSTRRMTDSLWPPWTLSSSLLGRHPKEVLPGLSDNCIADLVTIAKLFRKIYCSILEAYPNHSQIDFSEEDYDVLSSDNKVLDSKRDKAQGLFKWLENSEEPCTDLWFDSLHELVVRADNTDETFTPYDYRMAATKILSVRNKLVTDFNYLQNELWTKGYGKLSRGIIHKIDTLNEFQQLYQRFPLGSANRSYELVKIFSPDISLANYWPVASVPKVS